MARKLLLADDSITIQKVVELVLAEEDFEIKSVSNGEDALNAMNMYKPDIVLADIEMPRINGYQLCEKIKQNRGTAGIPVILLAGAFEPIDEELARKVGADDAVIKPFESQELISKINAALTMITAGGAGDIGVVLSQEGEEELEVIEESGGDVKLGVLETAEFAEDLWAMEEISSAPGELTAEAMTEEEEAGVENEYELREEVLSEEREAVSPQVTVRYKAVEEVGKLEVAVPSKEEMLKIFEKTINENVSALMASVDLRETLLVALTPLLKDTIEKVLWETAPELVEKMLKEVLRGSVSSITKEVEKVIWETVPDLAGTMISREIEKIRSEF
jgi:DNA-binding response OmpR family regulator